MTSQMRQIVVQYSVIHYSADSTDEVSDSTTQMRQTVVRRIHYRVIHYSTGSIDEVSDCGTERTIQCNALQY